ncbi:MAG: hypothetical protein A2Y77_02005 [Planctomycetes bacterium RBG_13_62_9]|nr:MAG: hypothetical protein A2Y77_02005 [Planctomycetes bacterium RBG_13_62_9]
MKNAMKARARDLAVLVAAVVVIASTAYGDSPTVLTDGVPLTGLSGAAASQTFYQIDLPAGQGELEIRISGGTGDCDLYVRRVGLPSFTQYDYRPYLFGNNETVTVESPASGTWYIMLRGNAAYSDVTLVADYTAAVPSELTNGATETGISGGDNSEIFYYIDVPAGQSSLEVNTWGGSGDIDLFIKRGSMPSMFDFDDRSFGGGTVEEVSITNPTAGRYYIMLRGITDYSGVRLRAVYGTFGPVTTLYDEVPITGLSGSLGSEKYFVIDVPSGQEGIMFRISGGTGDCDMYIKRGAKPTTSDWDYRPTDGGNDESISIGGIKGGDWYVLLVGDQAYSGVTLEADYWAPDVEDEVIALKSGVPVTEIRGGAGSAQFFSIEVPVGAKSLEIAMSGGTGDADLYVRKGSLPTTTQYDFRPYLQGNNEKVTIENPAAATWYIMIRGYQAFSGVTLVATLDGVIPDDATVLQNGVPVTGIGGASGDERFYKIVVPEGETLLEIETSDGTGDVDLYVRQGAKPAKNEWDFRPYLFGNEEKVRIENPKAGVYYIMLRGYMAFKDVTLKATYSPAPVPEKITILESCVPVTGLSGATDSEAYFKITVPADQKTLRIEISGGTGDADLYVKKGEKPTAKSWDYHPGLHGNNEVVEIADPAATTWYIMLSGYQAYSGLTLQACCEAKKKDCDDCIIIISGM